MTELTYSGMCLAAMFGSILYEHRRLKKEESRLRETLMQLANQTKHDAEAASGVKAAQPPAMKTVKAVSC